MNGVSPLLQAAASECSLACLAMVATAHGRTTDLQELRRRFPVGIKGASLAQLISQANALGFAARPLRLELDEMAELALPCILHWNLDHFVVLAGIGRRGLTVFDPAVGRRRLSLATVSKHFTGVAVELTPEADFRRRDRLPAIGLAQLSGRVHGLKRSLWQILIVAAALQFFALAAPLFNQVVVDDVIGSGDEELLTVLALGLGLLLLVQTCLTFARSWMVMVLGQTLSLQWSGNVFAHLIRLPIEFFEHRHLGDIVSRFGSVETIRKTLTTAAIEAVLDGIMAVAALAMMLLHAPGLAAVVLLAVTLYGLLRWAAYQPLRDAAAERVALAARENTHFLETLRGITPLRLFGREDGRRARWHNLLVDLQNRDVRTARLNMAFATANTLIFGIENLLVLWLGARGVMDSQSGTGTTFTVGMLFAFISYKTQFGSRVSALINHAVEFRMLGLHAERLSDIVLTAPERDSAGVPGLEIQLPHNDLSHLAPGLELCDVSFRYGEGQPWVLRHANFAIRAGESVAVTGASGCGKTTLLKIMLGLLHPDEGEVRYGGVAVHQLGMANVRRQLGTVMQEDVLLTGSLADNISFFDEQPDQSRVEACARIAQVHDEIARMPMGYQTLVGDLGSGLSGGQRQRVLLARALYKRPRVLALDEATSHLDLSNERAVAQALSSMHMTRLIIAHRPETIAGAQRVVQLKDRQILEVVRDVPTELDRASPGARSSERNEVD